VKLYGYWRSSSSYRVRILLNLKGVEHTSVPVHLVRDGGEQNAPAFAEKGPFRQVPVLEVDGPDGPRHLSQSMAIAEWLEETFPEPPLFPQDRWARARARELAEMVNSGIQPLQNLRVLRSLQASGMDPRPWCREVIGRGFAAIEARLAETAGAHAVGDALGLVEAFLVPQLYSARRFEVPLEPYPTLLRVEAACLEHPALVAAHPDAQPDAPPPDARTP
jgi:maleylpyruvate isomerase